MYKYTKMWNHGTGWDGTEHYCSIPCPCAVSHALFHPIHSLDKCIKAKQIVTVTSRYRERQAGWRELPTLYPGYVNLNVKILSIFSLPNSLYVRSLLHFLVYEFISGYIIGSGSCYFDWSNCSYSGASERLQMPIPAQFVAPNGV